MSDAPVKVELVGGYWDGEVVPVSTDGALMGHRIRKSREVVVEDEYFSEPARKRYLVTDTYEVISIEQKEESVGTVNGIGWLGLWVSVKAEWQGEQRVDITTVGDAAG